jgi:cytidylate kinase
MSIARELAGFLQERDPVPCQWTVFDRNLVTKMLEEHHLPEHLSRFVPEDHISRIRDVVEEIMGLHPPSETLVRQIGETAVHLAEMGHVILVGRGATVITRHMKNVFHVRIVAPMEKRVTAVAAAHQLGREAALDKIKREDIGQRRYFKHFFGQDPDAVMLYDLVLNTARLSEQSAARLIGEAVLEWSKSLQKA